MAAAADIKRQRVGGHGNVKGAGGWMCKTRLDRWILAPDAAFIHISGSMDTGGGGGGWEEKGE